MGVVTVNNNEVGKHLLNLRQGRKPSKHFMFVDFQNVCMGMEGEDFSLVTSVVAHFWLSC